MTLVDPRVGTDSRLHTEVAARKRDVSVSGRPLWQRTYSLAALLSRLHSGDTLLCCAGGDERRSGEEKKQSKQQAGCGLSDNTPPAMVELRPRGNSSCPRVLSVSLLLLLLAALLPSTHVVSAAAAAITRGDFPEGFVFGAGASAYQVGVVGVLLYLCLFLPMGSE